MATLDMVQQTARNPRENLLQVLRAVGTWSEIDPGLLVWSILRFEGVGTAPGGMTMVQFESCLAGNAVGYLLDWRGLVTFASGIEKTFSCTIAGASSVSSLTSARLCGELQRCTALLLKPAGGCWSLEQRSPVPEPAAQPNTAVVVPLPVHQGASAPAPSSQLEPSVTSDDEGLLDVLTSARPSGAFLRLAFSELRLAFADV